MAHGRGCLKPPGPSHLLETLFVGRTWSNQKVLGCSLPLDTSTPGLWTTHSGQPQIQRDSLVRGPQGAQTPQDVSV